MQRNKVTLKVLNPRGILTRMTGIPISRRLGDLNSKKIGVLNNTKSVAEMLLPYLEEALKKLEPFTLEGVAGKIECPFLLTHGEADAQISMDIARKEFEEVGSKDKTLKVFTREEGGAQHCQGDNLTIGTTYIADWLSDKLKSR